MDDKQLEFDFEEKPEIPTLEELRESIVNEVLYGSATYSYSYSTNDTGVGICYVDPTTSTSDVNVTWGSYSG